ncbi:MAG: hypothetical protein OEZ55_12750 [Nitrospinota bacterium]|nr:hypothetical protein [Nitrospinota bacterium]
MEQTISYGFCSRLVHAAAAMSFLLSGSSSLATPSSQVTIPSPDVTPQFFLHVDVDNTTTIMKKQSDGGHSNPVDIGLTFGIFENYMFGMEAGLDLREQTDYPLAYNFKVVLKEGAIARHTPGVAFGVYEMGDSQAKADINITYGLVSKSLPPVGRVAAGLYIGSSNRLLDDQGKEDSAGFLFSFDRTLAELDERLWVAVDYMSGAHHLGALSLGVAWRFVVPPRPAVSVLVGYNIYNNPDKAGDNTFTIRFDMDFGG